MVPRCSMGLEYLPTFTNHRFKPNAGKYSMHGVYAVYNIISIFFF